METETTQMALTYLNTFCDLREAWSELNCILYKIIALKNKAHFHQLPTGDSLNHGTCDSELLPLQQQLQASLHQWHTTYTTSKPHLDSEEPTLVINAIIMSFYTLAAILEGIWDCKIMSRIIRKVMEVEDGGLYEDEGEDFASETLPGIDELSPPELPLEERLGEIRVELDNEMTESVMVEYRKACHPAGWERVCISLTDPSPEGIGTL
ncbi:uncharacterized protein N0V89_009563 [Didymosphaeria variabile]|uniref:Uncharacterized protein n=1 Tax=Didymosphaeria variabile TaxID=1932322 RepID=A0A9W9C7E5_9PLEO|nr:uncharacterized protein N0V89_009563 [Didymosphaeria variabile]KAJ4348191.1 hypothetical protein N0V89_009563 [Didymosphaeria variabile]